MSELNEMIQNALNADVDLSEEEYKEKMEQADKSTEAHGMTKKAPLSEARRHKRIEMNYYGLSINYMANILGELVNTNRLLMELLRQNMTEGNDGGNARNE
jgi:hypothetical protein